MNISEYSEMGYLPSYLGIATFDNTAITVDDTPRLCLWNLTTNALIGSCTMEGVRLPLIGLLVHAPRNVVFVFSQNQVTEWSYAHIDFAATTPSEPNDTTGVELPSQQTTSYMKTR